MRATGRGEEGAQVRPAGRTAAAPSNGDDDRPFAAVGLGVDLDAVRTAELPAEVGERLMHESELTAAS